LGSSSTSSNNFWNNLERLFLLLLAVSLSIFVVNHAFATTIPVGIGPFDIASDPVTNMLYVTNSGSNTVSVINGSTNAVVATIPVGNGSVAINVNPNTHKVYLVNSNLNQIQVIDGLPGSPTVNKVIASIGVGVFPNGLDVNPATNLIYVGNLFSGTVSVINGSKNTVVGTIMTGSGASRVGIDAALHKIYVDNFFSNKVIVINSSSNTVIANITVGSSPVNSRLDQSTLIVYVPNIFSGSISVINGSTNVVVATIPVGNNPSGISLDPTHNKIYVAIRGTNSVSIINRTTNVVVASTPVGNLPQGLVFDPNNNKVYVGNFGDGTVSVLNALTSNPPVANAGPAAVVLGGTRVTLNGTGSGGTGPLSFSWTQTTGPRVVLAGSSTANPTFTAPLVNSTKVLTFALIVNDGTFSSIASSVNIIVKPISTFIVPLVPTNGTLQGITKVGNVTAGSNLDFEFVTPANTLASTKLLQSSVSSSVTGNNVSFNFTLAPTIPQNIPKPSINTALFFKVNTNGINFSNPANFPINQTPKTEFLVNKTFSSASTFPDGCPVIPFFLFNESTNQWNQVGNPLKPNTNMIYVVNSVANTINVINGSTNSVTGTITVGTSPFHVIFNQNTHMLYVTNTGSKTFSVVNTIGNTVLAKNPLVNHPTLF
jgi:YVTN family beta-propeller protein